MMTLAMERIETQILAAAHVARGTGLLTALFELQQRGSTRKSLHVSSPNSRGARYLKLPLTEADVAS
jgi:hypothetical protein